MNEELAEEVKDLEYYPVGVFIDKSVTIEIPLEEVNSQEEAERLVEKTINAETDKDKVLQKLIDTFESEVMSTDIEVVKLGEAEFIDIEDFDKTE
tara:strand:- start:309 stop:593 length:285 start_codon:yes stop_codon:yes gene_type:complete